MSISIIPAADDPIPNIPMKKSVSLGTLLLVVVVAVVAALLAYRAWFEPSSSRLDRENRELMARLDAHARTRDSLQTVIRRQDVVLASLQQREAELVATRDSLAGTLAESDRRIRQLQRSITRYDLPPDVLVRDLNVILSQLGAVPGTGSSR